MPALKHKTLFMLTRRISRRRRAKYLSGAATRTRTADLMITNQLLYQLSYCGGNQLKKYHRPYL